MSTVVPGFERATTAHVTVADGVVVKTTCAPLPIEGAEALQSELEGYHAALAAGPLAVAGLLGTDVLKGEGGYYVRHVMELVEGKPLTQLPYEERRAAIGELAQTVQGMPTVAPGDNRLLTPFDGKPRNVVKRPNGQKVLVDICPPYSWGEDSWVRTPLDPTMDFMGRVGLSTVVGYPSGILSELFRAAAPESMAGETPTEHALRVFNTASGWYADLIPAGMPPHCKRQLDDQLIRTLLVLTLEAQSGTLE